MKKTNLLKEAQKAEYVFISVMGSHADENPEEIFNRKFNDIKICKESFWVSKIWQTKALINDKIKECNIKLQDKDGYLILVEGKAKNTTGKKEAHQYSIDYKKKWKNFNDKISQVTGNFGNDGGIAYYFDAIERYDNNKDPINLNYIINLDFYSEVGNDSNAIKFRLGHSNVFAKKNPTKLEGGMNSHERKIVAVLHLIPPYVVWVK